MSGTSSASSRFAAGTMTRDMPCDFACTTAGSTPGTGSTLPSRLSSPSTTVRSSASLLIFPAAPSTLAAIARSCAEPRLGIEAGERFTVTRVCGHENPAAWHADRTRSRASLKEVSGSPMIEKYGNPCDTNACICTVNARKPRNPMEEALPILAIRTPPGYAANPHPSREPGC